MTPRDLKTENVFLLNHARRKNEYCEPSTRYVPEKYQEVKTKEVELYIESILVSL